MIISLLAGLLILYVCAGWSVDAFPSWPMICRKTMIVNARAGSGIYFYNPCDLRWCFLHHSPVLCFEFRGAYWVWMAILFSFVIQAVAYEYRSKPANVLGQKTYDIFLLINGLLGPFLIGVAVATFFTGSQFSLNNLNQVQWQTQWHGLEALLNIRNLSLGLAVLFLVRVNGLLYIINSIDDETILKRSRKRLTLNSILFLVFFLFFVIPLLVSRGFASDPETGFVSLVKFKYLKNLVQMPLVLILFLLGVVSVLYGIASTIFSGSRKGIWFTGSGTVLAVFSLFLTAGFNNTAFYPSTYDLQSSLTIRNIIKSFHAENNDMFHSSFHLLSLYGIPGIDTKGK